VLNPTPYGQQTVDATFTDFNGCLNAVNGMYAQFSNGNLYRGSNLMFEIDQASDDVMNEPLGSPFYNQVDYFELVANNGLTFGIMDEYYKIIYRANLIVERVPKVSFPLAYQSNGTGTSFNNQFVGEALFMRGLSYFNLVRILGGVPLRTKEITSASEVNLPKASTADVYMQIEKDLTEAAQKLPARYTNSGLGNERGRATRWSALILLADVYLTQKKYAEARNTALQVIQNGSGFVLSNTYAASFPALNGGNENTQESLFEIQFNNAGFNPTQTAPQGHNLSWVMGPIIDPVTNQPNLARYRPTDDQGLDNEPGFRGGLVQEYEAGDLRLTANFHQVLGNGGVIRWLTRKYYEPGRSASSTGNVVVYRIADAYLIYAEATNELSGPDVQSIDYINQLRRRAFGLPLNTTSAVDIPAGQNQSSFRNLIRSERRKELALENKRWFDMLRYGFDFCNQQLKVKQFRQNFSQNKMLFPFPEVELINNPLLEQNPGY
jgi:hypothetical protein